MDNMNAAEQQQMHADSAVFTAMREAGAYKSMAEAMVRKNIAEAELSENIAKEAHFKAAVMALKWEQEKLTTESHKDAVQRAKNLKRPCLTLGVQLREDIRDSGTVYIAQWSGLQAEGSSPEEACSNFDRMWVNGADEL